MTDDPKWDAPLTQAQWDACKWLFESMDDAEKAAA
jgi:hypothetical protein